MLVSTNAYSDSCAPLPQKHKTISEFVSNQDLIFEGTLEYLDDKITEDVKGKHSFAPKANRLASFQIDKLYKDKERDTVILYYNFDFRSPCRPSYFLKSKYISEGGKFFVIAQENNGYLYIQDSVASSGFDHFKEQLLSYFNNGKDGNALIRNDACFQIIKSAYDSEVFTGKFKLKSDLCENYLPMYDLLYRH